MRTPTRTSARISSFTVTTLWHRRLSRVRGSGVRVQPRVCAELILHPVVAASPHSGPGRADPKDLLDACDAA